MSLFPAPTHFKPFMSTAEYRIFVCEHFLVILLFACLLVLVVVNIWKIFIR